MIWSDLRGDTESQAETSWPPIGTRSAVTNVNGPKVYRYTIQNMSLSKNWPNAGKSENSLLPADSQSAVTRQEMRTIRRKGRIGNDSESSETIRQSPAQAGEDIVRTAWRHAGVDVEPHSLNALMSVRNSFKRNSLSGKWKTSPYWLISVKPE